MRQSVAFRASMVTKGTHSTSVSEGIELLTEGLKRGCPAIQQITAVVDSHDFKQAVGSGFKVGVSGLIYFKPNSEPDRKTVQEIGNQFCNDAFTLVEESDANK